jgi:tetratricopeptide (TPR) repeat protein
VAIQANRGGAGEGCGTAAEGGAPPFANRVVSFIGRLRTMPAARASRAVAAGGGRVCRLGRATDLGIVGRTAAADIGRIAPRLLRARQAGVRLISEGQFLRLAGATPTAATAAAAGATAHRAYGRPDLLAGSGLTAEVLEALELFDIVEAVDGRFAFRDLILVRAIRRLLAQGLPLADLIRDLAGRRAAFERLPADLIEDDIGHVAVGLGARVLELDGQLRLPLAGGDWTPPGELFEQAARAEADSRLQVAAALYRRCLATDPRDAAAAFNLANLRRRLGDSDEAVRLLRHALLVDPGFADAWYNLGLIAADAGRTDEAAGCFGRALAVDPSYADALFNLAMLAFREGRLTEAAALWQRFLMNHADGDWARRARHGLAICRRLARQHAGSGSPPVS